MRGRLLPEPKACAGPSRLRDAPRAAFFPTFQLGWYAKLDGEEIDSLIRPTRVLYQDGEFVLTLYPTSRSGV